jgi:hypothetical protein
MKGDLYVSALIIMDYNAIGRIMETNGFLWSNIMYSKRFGSETPKILWFRRKTGAL